MKFQSRCWSGQPICGVDQFVMIVGGFAPIELVSLNPDTSPVSPFLSIAEYPLDIHEAAGAAILPGGVPLICGGGINDYGNSTLLGVPSFARF